MIGLIEDVRPFDDSRPDPKSTFPELHHYTTICGLEGILGSNCLWATSYRFMNDATEATHIASYLEDALVPKIDKYLRLARKRSSRLDVAMARKGGPRSFARLIAHSVVGRNYDGTLYGRGPSGVVHCEPFLLSFCTHLTDAEFERDNGLLSQWRAYAAPEGVAIVFDTKATWDWLSREAREFPISLALSEVFYDEGPELFPRQFPTLVPTFLQFGVMLIEAGFPDAIEQSIASAPKLVEAAEFASMEFVANICRFKHRAFREEREVRIVACPLLEGAKDRDRTMPLKPVLLRGPASTRYIELGSRDFPPIENTIRRIIVGPSKNQIDLAEKVRTLTGDRIRIVRSSAPLIR